MTARESPVSIQANVGKIYRPPLGTLETPIHSLPPEVLLGIFEILFKMEKDEGAWRFDFEEYDTILRMEQMPDSVANVCTYWDFVASLEPKFWQMRLILIDPMQPNPFSRLQKRLERNKLADGLRIKTSPPNFSWASSTWYGRTKEGSDNGTKALERDRIGRMVPLIQKHAHRACTLAIATAFDSLPALETVFPTHPNGTESIQHLYLLSHSNTSQAPASTNITAQVAYPDPSIHPALEPSHFSGMQHLTLGGKAFVSFCRAYLTLHEGKYNMIGTKSEAPLGIAIVQVVPLDGGIETPFILDEFLQIIRLFCGRVHELRIHDVVLPLQVPTEHEEKKEFFANYPWIICKESASHQQPLDGIKMASVNSELVLGILRVFEHHILTEGRWRIWSDMGSGNHTAIVDLQNEIQAREPGVLNRCGLDRY